MNKKTSKLAYSGVIAALSVLLLYLSSVLPTLRIGLVAVAGVLPAVMVVRFGISSGFMVYAITSLITLILLPGKGTVLLYVVIFGHYPMFKSLFERSKRLWIEWVAKLALFNILLTLIILISDALIYDLTGSSEIAVPIIYLVGNVVFIAYDIGFTGLIAKYIVKFKI